MPLLLVTNFNTSQHRFREVSAGMNVGPAALPRMADTSKAWSWSIGDTMLRFMQVSGPQLEQVDFLPIQIYET